MNYRKGLAKKIHMSPCSFWRTKQFCHIFTPVDQLSCSILHKNGPTTDNEHFTGYNIMTLVCARWLHEVQWVLCTAFWSMDMTGVYACLFEAVCDVTTVPSHLICEEIFQEKTSLSFNFKLQEIGFWWPKWKAFLQCKLAIFTNLSLLMCLQTTRAVVKCQEMFQEKTSFGFN